MDASSVYLLAYLLVLAMFFVATIVVGFYAAKLRSEGLGILCFGFFMLTAFAAVVIWHSFESKVKAKINLSPPAVTTTVEKENSVVIEEQEGKIP